MNWLDRLGITVPIIQAPMAGVSTPALAAAVSNAGALGSIGVGAVDATGAHRMIVELQARTERAFNVNLFVHATPKSDPVREAVWLEWMAPIFAEFGATPPRILRSIYKSFHDDPEMLAMLLEVKPPVISFHFGLPSAEIIAALKNTGALLLGTVTNFDEARAAQASGIDILVAQGIEAGGHRGVFDPALPDDALGTSVLTRLLVKQCQCPIVAAGGIMDGAGIAAALDLGAVAAQMGTTFILCTETSADAAYRRHLQSQAAFHTRITHLISGRPARCLPNRFTDLLNYVSAPACPDYPIAYDAGKALNVAAKAGNEDGFGAQWAGQGAPLARSMPAAQLVEHLRKELDQARHPDSEYGRKTDQ
ncbi:NAD(P)H-dependent flavin oxidoreductase [Kozakia baliensis]|uniref:Nitronate monooxygenase n=1 Tax=Kozakia baliensis TaxID=153496 RepID=A0A1D8UT01_9PROT|nr:nitronate monooxygenase [Kozakia baliensis]AOX16769.1 2-nitropropane dioxygenase [Kozakia baliensis]GBR31982.1 enoyl-ACP reductase [Kozakia baliensis NRIC 0488]GEL64682.1 2-nitropropane dioxygenase [Kozakia baliensis]